VARWVVCGLETADGEAPAVGGLDLVTSVPARRGLEALIGGIPEWMVRGGCDEHSQPPRGRSRHRVFEAWVTLWGPCSPRLRVRGLHFVADLDLRDGLLVPSPSVQRLAVKLHARRRLRRFIQQL